MISFIVMEISYLYQRLCLPILIGKKKTMVKLILRTLIKSVDGVSHL